MKACGGIRADWRCNWLRKFRSRLSFAEFGNRLMQIGIDERSPTDITICDGSHQFLMLIYDQCDAYSRFVHLSDHFANRPLLADAELSSVSLPSFIHASILLKPTIVQWPSKTCPGQHRHPPG